MTKFAYIIERPFNYHDASQALTGCDVELARHVLGQVGDRRFEPVETKFAQLLPGLGSRWRMTTGLFRTEERQATAAFSRPIWALSDGLLVRRGNPHRLSGYTSIADARTCTLAVGRDQVQHRSAVELGVPVENILIFDTYDDAAQAVLVERAGAYASVARAHAGFIQQNGAQLDIVPVSADEKKPAFGCFAFSRSDDALRQAVDDVLATYLGSREHRILMARFGFTNSDVDLIAR